MTAAGQAIDAKNPMTQRELHEIPKWARIVLVFVERVGTPMVAFFIVAYMSVVSLKKIEVALTENTKALSQFIESSNRFQTVVVQDHLRLMREIEDLRKP